MLAPQAAGRPPLPPPRNDERAGPMKGVLFSIAERAWAGRTPGERALRMALVPAAVVAALIFSFNLLGDALADVLTPRAR